MLLAYTVSDTFGSSDGHSPHLRVYEAQAFDDRVRGSRDRYCMRTSVQIGGAIIVQIPDMAVAVQGAVSMPVEMYLIASEVPCRALILESNW